MPLFVAAIFVSAFLLFQVQPVIARYILPWYGGSPAVWTTCLLFFQSGLLIGYAYAHGLATLFRKHPKRQILCHAILLVVSLLLLPITPPDSLKPEGTEASPALGIALLLLRTVGLPYILLSASGPLFQHWFAGAFPGRSPYRLYAVSNAGSILGLVTYPFLFEPLLGVETQTRLWSFAFAAFAALAIACGVLFTKRSRLSPSGNEEENSIRPALIDVGLWIAFAACGSMLLLSLTNQMCQDVAVVPFLWVAPLALYLLTFVIAFDHERWYFRPVWLVAAGVAVGAVVHLINQQYATGEMPLAKQLLIYLGAIFAGCMVCHGEVVRIKPDVRHLTGFYLAISFGGALGGMFVSLAAPLWFDGYWELHVSLLLLATLTTFAIARDGFRHARWKLAAPFALVGIIAGFFLFRGLHEHYEESLSGVLDSRRSFYGVLRIHEENIFTDDVYRALYHGRISHGRQYLDEAYRDLATTYYNVEGGIGASFETHPKRNTDPALPMHIGVVGLGVGTLATYAEPGDRVRFYEINPQVEELAREWFTYLGDCEGEETVVIGDARISLEQELSETGSQQFDVLVVDAFSGDSIPIHLMTEEAFRLYAEHLAENGILAVHISNLHLDLSDPVRTAAEAVGLFVHRVECDPDDDNHHSYYSDWILLSRDPNLGTRLATGGYLSGWLEEVPKEIRWTDDYSNLLDVVDWEWE